MKRIFSGLSLLLLLADWDSAGGQMTKLVVAYASPAATFCPGWIAKREGIFGKHNLDVEMVLMQGASMYMPALASGNIQVLYGGGTGCRGPSLPAASTSSWSPPRRATCRCG